MCFLNLVGCCWKSLFPIITVNLLFIFISLKKIIFLYSIFIWILLNLIWWRWKFSTLIYMIKFITQLLFFHWWFNYRNLLVDSELMLRLFMRILFVIIIYLLVLETLIEGHINCWRVIRVIIWKCRIVDWIVWIHW